MKKFILLAALTGAFSFMPIQETSATIIVVCNGNDVDVYYDDDGCGLDIEYYGCDHF